MRRDEPFYKGLHTVEAKGKTYHYAWRGGPRVHGEYGTPAFHASYQEAVASVRAPDPARFRALVTLYKASAQYEGLADSTRKAWAPWLDRIAEHFAPLNIAQFDRPAKIQPLIRRWRNKWEAKPRTADYGLQVLSRVLSHAVEAGKIGTNPCEGIKQLYSADRSGIIWTDADITQIKSKCANELAWAVDLAAHTGLRRGDMIRLAWSHIGDDAIVMTTGKSRQRKEAIIPLYDDLKAVLARIPRRSPIVLTHSKGRPWKGNGLGTAINRAYTAAKMEERDLHFHDLRGTAATKFYIAGLSERVVAEIMGWEEDYVAKIIRRYVGRTAATKAAIERLNRERSL